MKIFLTGATGFLGSHVARALVAAGADLRLLTRKTSPTANLNGVPGERVVGDLRDVNSYRTALSGCDCVFHVAADYRLWARDPQEMYRSNVDGTRALLEAAQQAGIKRVVYTSSVATMGFTGTGGEADENSPVSLDDMIGHYKRSKFMAEQIALKSPITVVVNPTTPIGEYDIKPTPTGRIVLDFLRRKFPAYVDTGLNLVDATVCANGHLLALEKGRPGERYILGGENLTLKQILDKLSAISGIPAPTVKVPHAVAMVAAVGDTFVTGYIRGREPRATIDAIRMGRKKMFVTSAKAERELGFTVVSVQDALRRAVEWFRSNGYA